MALTIEQSQQLTDLRQKMLRNVALGKPSHEGVKEEDLTQALEFLRSNRSVPAKAAAKRTAAKAEANLKPVDPKFNDMLSALD